MRTSLNHVLVIMLGLALLGCSDDDTGVCSPAATKSCACPGGGNGTMTCDQDGKAWGSCAGCSATDGGQDGATDGGTDGPAGDGTTSDGTAKEGGAKDGPDPDSGLADQTVADAYVGKYTWRALPMPSATKVLNGIWGSGPDNIFIVGSAGTLLHMTDKRSATGAWAVTQSATTQTLHGVWGSGAKDVMAAGESGALVWYNGHTWSSQTSGTTTNLRALWGSGLDNIYAPGEKSVLQHNARDITPNKWTAVTLGTGEFTILGAWGTSAKDVFMVGTKGTIVHHDGTAWKAMTSGTNYPIEDVWDSGTGHQFAVGLLGTALYRCGK